jgi:hypothetical protein
VSHDALGDRMSEAAEAPQCAFVHESSVRCAYPAQHPGDHWCAMNVPPPPAPAHEQREKPVLDSTDLAGAMAKSLPAPPGAPVGA